MSRIALLAFFFCVLPCLLGSRWPVSTDSGLALHVDPVFNTGNIEAVADGEGGLVVFWTQFPPSAQRFDRNGAPVWGTAPVVVTDLPVSTSLSAQGLQRGAQGDYICLWSWRNNGNLVPSVMKLSAAGQRLWPGNGIQVTDLTTTDSNFDLIAQDDGGALVVWQTQPVDSADIWMNRVYPGGTLWDPGGERVSAAAGGQWRPRMVTDGQDGAIVVWEDRRSDVDIYAQRMSSTGSPLWAADGVPVGTAANIQLSPRLAPDGAGGVFVCWLDRRSSSDFVYAQYLDGNGNPLWTLDGIPVSAPVTFHSSSEIAPDGAGGAVIAWYSYDSPLGEVRAQRLDGAGTQLWGATGVTLSAAVPLPAFVDIRIEPAGSNFLVTWDNEADDHIEAQLVDLQGNVLWAPGGLDVCTHPATQSTPVPVPDDRGGAYVVWRDDRGVNFDPYGHHIMPGGELGYPSPRITSLVDFPQDQGSQMVMSWNKSFLDRFGNMGMAEYWTWRRLPGAAAKPALALPASVARVAEAMQLAASGWEYLGATPPMDLDEYADTMPTYGDSTDLGIQLTEFMVSTYVGPGEFYSSEIVSGYSIDDIPPLAPLNFSVDYGPTTNQLGWEPSEDTDIRAFRVYRSTDPGFIPDPSTRIAETADLFLVDSAAEPWIWHYKVSEVDQAGNEGPAAVVQTVTGTPDLGRYRTGLHTPAPNPFSPRTMIAFDLARDQSRVVLEVYDTAGRRVRTLHRGSLPAGRHQQAWDGRNEAGAELGAGVYFVRMETGEQSFTRKVIQID